MTATVRFLPLALLLGLGGAGLGLLAAHAPGDLLLAGAVTVGVAVLLALAGTRWRDLRADGLALGLASVVLVGAGFAAGLGVELLFLLVVAILFTAHLLRFRATVRPLAESVLPAAPRHALGTVLLSLLRRLFLLLGLAYLVSLVLLLALLPATVDLPSELAVVLLALGVLLALLTLSLLGGEGIINSNKT